MKKFFVEPGSATFLLRDENGIPAGEFAVEANPDVPGACRAAVRIAGKPTVTYLDLKWAPDVSDHVGICREIVKTLEPNAEVATKVNGELCQDAYRPTPTATSSIWLRLSKVISAFSAWRAAGGDRQQQLSDLLETLYTLEQPLEFARDELGRQHWWATCVLCRQPYRHYPHFVPYQSLGPREVPKRNEGVHTDDKVCEECTPIAVRHRLSFGAEAHHRWAVVVGGSVHYASDVEVIATGTPDVRENLRRMYGWMIDMLNEEKSDGPSEA